MNGSGWHLEFTSSFVCCGLLSPGGTVLWLWKGWEPLICQPRYRRELSDSLMLRQIDFQQDTVFYKWVEFGEFGQSARKRRCKNTQCTLAHVWAIPPRAERSSQTSKTIPLVIIAFSDVNNYIYFYRIVLPERSNRVVFTGIFLHGGLWMFCVDVVTLT